MTEEFDLSENQQFYSRTKFAEKIGRCRRTLERWEKEQLLVPGRYKSGRPFYTYQHYQQALSLRTEI